MRVAGKLYVLDGSDETKLAVLRTLSASDFLSVPWRQVSSHLKLVNHEGAELSGVGHASMLSVPSSHSELFGPLIEALAAAVPEQLRCIDGEYQVFKLELPQDPLTVTTVVMELDDGRLEAMVSG